MLPHSKVMIHDPYFGRHRHGRPEAPGTQGEAERLMETRKMLAEVIVEQTGMSKRQVLNFTKKDTFFDAKEALKVGIATEILGESPKSPSSGEGDGFRPVGKGGNPLLGASSDRSFPRSHHKNADIAKCSHCKSPTTQQQRKKKGNRHYDRKEKYKRNFQNPPRVHERQRGSLRHPGKAHRARPGGGPVRR